MTTEANKSEAQPSPGKRSEGLVGAGIAYACALVCFLGSGRGMSTFLIPPHAFALALVAAGLYQSILLPISWRDRAKKTGDRSLPSWRIEVFIAIVLFAAFPFSSLPVLSMALSIALLFALGGLVRLLLMPARRFLWIALVVSGFSIAVPSIVHLGEIVASAGKSNFAPMQFQWPLQVAWSWRSASIPMWLFRVGSGDFPSDADFRSGVNTEYVRPPKVREVDTEDAGGIAFAEVSVFGDVSARPGRALTLRVRTKEPRTYRITAGEDYQVELSRESFETLRKDSEGYFARWIAVPRPPGGGVHQSILDENGEILLSRMEPALPRKEGMFDVLVVVGEGNGDSPAYRDEGIRFTAVPSSDLPARIAELAGFSAVIDTRVSFSPEAYGPFISAGGIVLCALPRGPEAPNFRGVIFAPSIDVNECVPLLREELLARSARELPGDFDSLSYYPPMTRFGVGSQFGIFGAIALSLVFLGLLGMRFLPRGNAVKVCTGFLVILPLAFSMVVRLAFGAGTEGNIERFDVLVSTPEDPGVDRISAVRFEPPANGSRAEFSESGSVLTMPLFVASSLGSDPNLRRAGFRRIFREGVSDWELSLRLREERLYFVEFSRESFHAPELTARKSQSSFEVKFVDTALGKIGGVVVFISSNSVIPVGNLESGDTREVALGSMQSFESYISALGSQFRSDAFSFSGALKFFRANVSYRSETWVIGFVTNDPDSGDDPYPRILKHPVLIATPVR